jgi:ribulose-5-phosphate 4-epimerase/fuculose-1-phosphate aldolase
MTAQPNLRDLDASAHGAVAAMRETVAALHRQLTAYDLGSWTAGNVSGRVRVDGAGEDLMVIKPSGVGYGHTPRDAVKAAVMCEDVARTVHVARQLGTPVPIPLADIDRLHDRYQNVYGRPAAHTRSYDRLAPPS